MLVLVPYGPPVVEVVVLFSVVRLFAWPPLCLHVLAPRAWLLCSPLLCRADVSIRKVARALEFCSRVESVTLLVVVNISLARRPDLC